jgi:hypothetical protein
MSADYLSQSINDILSIARLAPSVHNTQPWKVKLNPDHLEISLDRNRALTHGDPTGRQAFLSLGIFTEACLIGLKYHGFKPLEPKLSGDSVSLKVASKQGEAEEFVEVESLKKRFTDRTLYKKVDLSRAQLAKINNCWRNNNVEVRAVSDIQIIERTAELTRQALLLAFSNPGFRKELTEYFVTDSSKPYGIPLNTLGTGRVKARVVKRLINSGLNRQQEAGTEYKRWLSASAVVFILAEGDSRSYWLESGRAYLRASLEIEKLGFNQATSAAIAEAADFHEDIEKLLGTDKRIMSVIRVGRGSKKKAYSGRLSAKELLTT